MSKIYSEIDRTNSIIQNHRW